MTLYRKEIIERYRFPRHRGEIKDADLQGEVINDLCGDELILFVKLDKAREKVVAAKFGGQGCALMSASADIFCSDLLGKSLAELKNYKEDGIFSLYGEEVTPARRRCVLLPLEALRAGLEML